MFDFADIITFTSVFELIFFILFIAFKSIKPYHNKILALFFLTQMLGILYWILNKHQITSPLTQIISTFSLLWAPTLFLYAEALTKKKEKPSFFDILHAIPFIIILLYSLARAVYQLPKLKYGILINTQVIIYNILGIIILVRYNYRVKENFSNDESKTRKWVAIALIGYMIACFTPSVLSLLNIVQSPSNVLKSVIDFLPFLIFFNILFVNAVENPVLVHELPSEERYKGSNLSDNLAQEYLKQLDHSVEKEKCYLEPELSLGNLSEISGIPSRYLSQIINQYKGKTFYDYINGLRVKHACNLLITDEKKTVLEILYESGFNSKTSFNTSFKKHTGLSPSEYKANFK